MDKKEIFEKDFLKPIIFWGIVTMMIASVGTFLPPLYMYFFHGIMPSAKAILGGFAMMTTFVMFWIIEPISYFPILGVPGTYMAFLSGNISNVRVPCSAIAQQAAGVQEGSMEGSIISTIGIGTSVIVNISILTLGVLFGAGLVGNFPPVVKQAFSFILPAIFGGIFGQFALRSYKLSLVAIILGIILVKTKLIIFAAIPLSVFGTIYIGMLMNKRTAAANSISSTKSN